MDEAPAAEVVSIEPAPLWRNWYRSLVDHNTSHDGPKRAGEEWPGEGVFATPDAAEARALVFVELHEWIAETTGEPLNALYLGPRQEE